MTEGPNFLIAQQFSFPAIEPVVSFHVPGSPAGEPRAQPSRAGGRLRMHRNASADPWKQAVRSAALKALELESPPREPLLGEGVPLLVALTFWLKRPASYLRRAGAALPHHTSKPDTDNLAKAVLDALAGWPKSADPILWWDDAQVVELRSRKEWASNENQPGLWIEVHRLG